MTCKFCNSFMNTVYTCGPDGIVKKYYRCHNCHNETKPVGINCDEEFKPNGQKNNAPTKQKKQKKERKGKKTQKTNR